MTTASPEAILGYALGPHFAVGEMLLYDAKRTVFRATDNSVPENPQRVAVILDTSGDEDSEARFRRYLEARFLEHENLMPILRAGRVESQDGRGNAYLVVPEPGEILTRSLESAPLALGDIRRIAVDILSGLQYLHREDLVFCALRPNAVWRFGDRWKLSDFSQLRVPGSEPLGSARRLLTRRDLSAPPEVYYGQVTPAWDVWSFGAMIGRIARPPRPNERTGAESSLLPPDLDELIGSCSDPDPGSRPSVAALLRAFSEAAPVQAAPVQAAPVQAAPVQAALVQAAQAQAARESIVDRVAETAAGVVHDGVHYVPVSRRPSTYDRIPEPAKSRVRVPWGRLIPVACAGIALFIALLLFARKPGSSEVQPVTGSASQNQAQPALEKSRARTRAASAQPAEAARDDRQPSGTDVAPREKAEIEDVLSDWAGAVRDHNAADQMTLYGPVIDTYYGRHNLTAAELRAQKQQIFSAIGTVRQFRVSNIHFDRLGPDVAVVSFDKQWAFGRPGGYGGAARDQMVLRHFGDQWKITSERELRVYSSHKQGPPV